MFGGLFYRERRYADESTKQFTPSLLIIGKVNSKPLRNCKRHNK